MKVYALMASHVVWLTWVHEEVGLGASLNTFGNERQTVLWDNGLVVISGNYLQLSFQVRSLSEK